MSVCIALGSVIPCRQRRFQKHLMKVKRMAAVDPDVGNSLLVYDSDFLLNSIMSR